MKCISPRKQNVSTDLSFYGMPILTGAHIGDSYAECQEKYSFNYSHYSSLFEAMTDLSFGQPKLGVYV